MTSFDDAQKRCYPTKSNWICWICRKQKHNMELHSCARIPRHIRMYQVQAEDHILTTVCKDCLEKESSYMED